MASSSPKSALSIGTHLQMRGRRTRALRAVLNVVCAFSFVFAGGCGTKTTTTGERDAIVERTWLDDPDSTLSPEAALGRVWTPFDGTLARGYVRSTTWLRLRIDPAAAGPPSFAADHRIVLVIVPGHLDEIAVYRTDRLTEPPVLVGDTQPAPTAGQVLMSHTVVFDGAEAPFEVLLRLRTQSTHSIDVRALRWDDAREQDLWQHGLIIGWLVFMLMVLAWAVSVWLGQRDRLLGLFVAHQVLTLFMTTLMLGVFRRYGPDWLEPALDSLTSLSLLLNTALTAWFLARLLGDLDVRKTPPTILRASILGPLVGLVLVGFGLVHAGLFVHQVSVPLFLLAWVISAWRVQLEPASELGLSTLWRRSYLIAVCVVTSSLAAPQSLRALGLIPAPRSSFLGILAYSFATALSVVLLLAYRASEAKSRRRRGDLERKELQREAAAQRARATEQSELLTMLSHELKTPLSVVSLALLYSDKRPAMRPRALRAIDNMRDVVERCEQTARYDDEMSRVGMSPAFAPVALDGVLESSIQALGLADRLDREVAAGLPPCHTDRQMVQIVVTNLLENAIKYGPPEGRVRVYLDPAMRDERDGVALRVANLVGPAGRPDPAHLFEKYHRGARARQQSGSGLGLYLSHRLTMRLGGALSLREPEGEEVEFELWLPCQSAVAEIK